MVGELKKNKYLYYHCTGNGDPNCPNKRHSTHSVDIEKQSIDSLRAIQLDTSVLPSIIALIKEASKRTPSSSFEKAF